MRKTALKTLKRLVPRKSISVRLGVDETGWALDNGDGTVEIDNIPLTDGLNIGDVVKVSRSNGWLVCGEVVSRKFENKSFVRFDGENVKPARLKQFVTELEKTGGKAERFLKNIIAVVYHDDFDLDQACDRLLGSYEIL